MLLKLARETRMETSLSVCQVLVTVLLLQQPSLQQARLFQLELLELVLW